MQESCNSPTPDEVTTAGRTALARSACLPVLSAALRRQGGGRAFVICVLAMPLSATVSVPLALTSLR